MWYPQPASTNRATRLVLPSALPTAAISALRQPLGPGSAASTSHPQRASTSKDSTSRTFMRMSSVHAPVSANAARFPANSMLNFCRCPYVNPSLTECPPPLSLSVCDSGSQRSQVCVCLCSQQNPLQLSPPSSDSMRAALSVRRRRCYQVSQQLGVLTAQPSTSLENQRSHRHTIALRLASPATAATPGFDALSL